MTLTPGFYDVPPGMVVEVVTYLDMPVPQRRGVPCPDGVTFAPFRPDVATYRDLFARVGAPWLWFSRAAMADDELAKIIHDPFIDIYVLQKDGVAEGLLELDFRHKGACELAFFGLTPALIGTGAGAFLMDRAVDLAFGKGIDRFHVHTCTLDHPGALAFYTRSGFKPIRQQIEIAPDPRLNGTLPRDAGAHVPIFEG